MPSIEFEADSAEIQIDGDSTSVKFRISLDWESEVKLSTEDMFSDLNGTIYLQYSKNAPLNTNEVVGNLFFFPEDKDPLDPNPACYQIVTSVSKIQFNSILRAALTNRLPSKIVVDVEGIKYGWRPDGKDKIWDNKSFPVRPVKHVSVTIPVNAQHATDESKDDEPVATQIESSPTTNRI